MYSSLWRSSILRSSAAWQQGNRRADQSPDHNTDQETEGSSHVFSSFLDRHCERRLAVTGR
jgi:hypothetical protein